MILRTIRTPVDTRTSIEVLVRLITRPRGRPVFLYVISIVYRLVIKVVLHRSCLRPCRAISLATPWQVSNLCIRLVYGIEIIVLITNDPAYLSHGVRVMVDA